MGVITHSPARVCFLSQELCGFQCLQSPLTLTLSLFVHLHLQHSLHLFRRLFLRTYCLHCRPLSCRLLFILFL